MNKIKKFVKEHKEVLIITGINVIVTTAVAGLVYQKGKESEIEPWDITDIEDLGDGDCVVSFTEGEELIFPLSHAE